MSDSLIEQLDDILPQTQCGLCGYGGCLPYAKALVKDNAAINLCPPGGVPGLTAIGKLMAIDPTPLIAEMKQKAKPTMKALIREADCIGCAKCIEACPVDAILGARKQMHTIIQEECTGCELCVSPCPVDCIDMVLTPEDNHDHKKMHYRERFRAREKRKQREKSVDNINLNDRAEYIRNVLLRKKK